MAGEYNKHPATAAPAWKSLATLGVPLYQLWRSCRCYRGQRSWETKTVYNALLMRITRSDGGLAECKLCWC